jgi:AcrR family transcriptional regulator
MFIFYRNVAMKLKTRPIASEMVTRERLLEAAGEVFAREGFRSATVRDICRRAGANVAAVKYHFGDKQKLYSAAVHYAHDCAKRFPVDEGLGPDPTPRQRLEGFVRAMLMGVLEPGRPAWHAKLMAREMVEPTAVLQKIADQGVKPRLQLLAGIIRSVVGPDVPDVVVRRCARSIVGQTLFYHFARPMLERVFPDERLDASAIDSLAAHIAEFSLGGLLAMKEAKAP